MSTEEAPRGWARLPRWQHVALIGFCVLAVVAAIANAVVARSNGNRAIHLAFGVLVAGVLSSLIASYRRRPR